jgi:hypothetical protein
VQTVDVLLELMNPAMREIRQEAEALIAVGELTSGLQELIDAGLTQTDGGVYFTKFVAGNSHMDQTSLGQTGHEALVNKLHLEDYLDTDPPDWATRCVAQGVLLGRQVLTRAAKLTPMPIDVVLSADLGGVNSYPSATFRFYGHRPDDRWTTDDVDRFRQPVAILRPGPSA